MAFFPLSNINEVNGFCEVHNYPPNDWEKTSVGPKHLWGIYSNGKKWIAKEICSLIMEKSKAEVNPSQITLKEELNKIGLFQISVNFHSEVKAKISIKIDKIKSK